MQRQRAGLLYIDIYNLLEIMKFGRHMRDGFKLSKKAKLLAENRAKLFATLAETYLFWYKHSRLSRSEFRAPGNWDIFMNVINLEAQQGLRMGILVKTLYGLEDDTHMVSPEYSAYSGFVQSHILRPLCWIGFLEAVDKTTGTNEKLFMGKHRCGRNASAWTPIGIWKILTCNK